MFSLNEANQCLQTTISMRGIMSARIDMHPDIWRLEQNCSLVIGYQHKHPRFEWPTTSYSTFHSAQEWYTWRNWHLNSLDAQQIQQKPLTVPAEEVF